MKIMQFYFYNPLKSFILDKKNYSISTLYIIYNIFNTLYKMAKSLRSKVKKRWRALKMNYLTEVAVKPHLEQLSKKL